jgi:hypothetical protein
MTAAIVVVVLGAVATPIIAVVYFKSSYWRDYKDDRKSK